MKRVLSTLGAVMTVMWMTAAAHAIEIKPFNCQKAAVVELVRMARSRGNCLSACVARKQLKPSSNQCTRTEFPPVPFDSVTAACAAKAVTLYTNALSKRCTCYMPTCGGFLKGFCSNNTSVTCNQDGDCPPSGNFCRGRCETTTSTSCDDSSDCPGGEECVSSTTTKDVGPFAADNLIAALGQIDSAQELLFQCRQRVCSLSGALCGSDDDCPGDVCVAGRCSDNAGFCNYDGDCNAKKKCLPLGSCSTAATACVTDADCVGTGPCLRYGRCSGPTKEVCFANSDCPGIETCGRSTVDTSRLAEQTCTRAVGSALGGLSLSIANCQAACALERDVRNGLRCEVDPLKKCKLAATCGSGACSPTSCDPFAIGRCSVTTGQVCAGNTDCPAGETCIDTTPDPISGALKACRDKAKAKAIAAINKKCPTLPACGAYSPFGGLIGNFNTPQQLLGFVTGVQDGQFKEDNPDLSPGNNFCEPLP